MDDLFIKQVNNFLFNFRYYNYEHAFYTLFIYK